MSTYKIRPHHGLCIAFFEGKGYSEEFTRNMERLIQDLKPDTKIRLTMGIDDICSACPSCYEKECRQEDSVGKMDQTVAGLLGWKDSMDMSWVDMQEIIRVELIDTKQMKLVCGDCQWSYICFSES